MFAYPQAFFTLGYEGALFAGRGVIVRTNGDDDVGATLTLEQPTAKVGWLPAGEDVESDPPSVEVFETFEEMLQRLKDRQGETKPLIGNAE